MDIFNNTPTYKKVSTVSKVATHAQSEPLSGLSSLLGSVFGSATPAYKTADGASAQAIASSGFLGSLLPVTAPSYKTVQSAPVSIDAAEYAASEDSGVDDGSCAFAPISDEVVLL